MICSMAQRCRDPLLRRSARSCCGRVRSRSRRPDPAAPNTTPTNGDQRWKLRLRSSCQPGCSEAAHSRIGRRVRPLVDRRRSSLEHVEMLGISAEVRNQLHARGAGSDERDALVRQLVQPAVGVAAGVVVVPARRVEDVPLEVLDPGDAGQLRAGCTSPAVMTTKRARMSSPRLVLDPPALDRLVPAHRRAPGWRRSRRRRARNACRSACSARRSRRRRRTSSTG